MATGNKQRKIDRVFLIGYRGAGKTTVAKVLAARLGWDWVDSDDRVEETTGQSIAQIFGEEGETAFRNLEEDVVRSLCEPHGTVVALGGGAVLRQASRDLIRTAGPVVWLTASPAYLAERLEADPTTSARRPSLTGQSVLEEIKQVLAQRTPTYQSCATLMIDTEGKPPSAIADEIIQGLGLE